MEDYLKFLLIAGAILVGIFKEVNKSGKSKKAGNKHHTPPMTSPDEVFPENIPMPEAWTPRPSGEPFNPIPIEPPVRKKPSRQQAPETSGQAPKRKKEEISVAASIANSAAQDRRNSRQDSHYAASAPHESPDQGEDFEIRSVEEARRAIVWGEILRRKY